MADPKTNGDTSETATMTKEAFEHALVCHGPSIEAWPSPERSLGVKFAATTEGEALLQEHRALDALFAGSRAAAKPMDSAFLNGLMAIPSKHTQQEAAAAHAPGVSSRRFGLGGLLGRLLEPARLWSPTGFAAQGALCALVLAVGVFVGMQEGQTVSIIDYDISAGLFDEADDDFLLEG